jgi:hypothetical protein
MAIHEYRPRRRRFRPFRGLAILAVLVAAGWAIYHYGPWGPDQPAAGEQAAQASDPPPEGSEKPGEPPQPAAETPEAVQTPAEPPSPVARIEEPPEGVDRETELIPVDEPAAAEGNAPAAAASTPPELPFAEPVEISAERALEAFRSGMKHLTDPALRDELKARRLLNRAYRSGRLDEATQQQARQALEELARSTIFSRLILKDDPLTLGYRIQSGEVLAGPGGVIRREEFRVPYQVILRINGLESAAQLQAGRMYKMLRGPFHAVVYRSRRVMDVYLQDTFVKRFRVCVGAPQSPTPTGSFRVVLGGKLLGATYYPPAGSPLQTGPLGPGDPEYPLDRQGHFIKLEGLPGTNTPYSAADGYALHGTNEPESIGEARSLGCVRLSDEDIREIFSMLYEHWSTVTILP